MPDKTPRKHTAVASLPGCSMHDDSTRAHAVSGLITLSCPNTDGFIISLHPGTDGASRVLRRLSFCIPWPEDSGGPPHPSHCGCFVLPSRTLKLSASATRLFRSCTSTSGNAISPTVYRILCVRLPCNLVRSLRRSAAGPTLDTGGRLTLTRRGLSPRKRRRALLGAISRRDAGYPAPPAQSRTCSFPASGSSVVLTFARTFTVTRYKAQLLWPYSEVGSCAPILHVRHEFPV